MIGSVAIVWQIHVDHVYQAYSRLNGLPSQLQLHAIHFISIPGAKRWEGLPFLWHGQDVDEIGPIESSPCMKQDPHPLPQGLEWSILTCSNIDEIFQVFTNIDDASFISRSFFKWLISSPLYKEGCLLGIRLSSSQKLVSLVIAVPYNIRIGRKMLPLVNLVQVANPNVIQPDQICNAGIKEVMRILGHEGIFQATLFTQQHVIPKSVTTFGYYIWNLRLHSLPYTTPRTVGLRRMKPSDVPKAFALTNQYTSQFEIAQVFQSEEEFSHWFLSPLLDDLATYVVEEPISGNITDMFSYRTTDDITPFDIKEKIVLVIALVITKTPAKQLITDLLIICMKQQNDYVGLRRFGLRKHLFMDCQHYHQKHCSFYNYKYPAVDDENFCIFGTS